MIFFGKLVAQLVKEDSTQQVVYTQESLAEWKQAVALVLANRSAEDQQSLSYLGQQLKQTGLHQEGLLW